MIDTIVNSFDIWSDAQGIKSRTKIKGVENISLEGISCLRELILELAVLGKLVPQDPNDEPATFLLTKIKKEREKKKIIKKEKKVEQIYSGKIFNIKIAGWELCKLEDIGDTNIGLTYSPNDVSNIGTIVLRSSNIQKGEIELSDIVRVNKSIKENVLVKQGDLLICARNGSKKLVGKCALIRNLHEPMAFGAFMALFRSEFNEYCRIFIESPIYRRNLEGVATTTINQITQDNLKNTYIPLPPLAEQKRIVAKVDELMALCDKLENEQFNNLKTHQILVKTLLETLTQAKDADELQVAWNRLSAHFDELFCTDDSIDQLKQTILQLAVMGKLVKQDPKDEPASELLKRIEKERGAKKDNLLQEIKDNEKPFEIANGWVWVRLQQIIQISSGDGLTSSNMESNGDIPVYGGNGINGYHNKGNISKPTLVIGRVGYYCGSIHITPSIAWVTDNAFITTFSEANINLNFLYWLLKGTNLKENDSATAQPVISGRKVYPIVVALPPLSEQKRIVHKIDELFSICEALREKIQKSQDLKILLSKTIVEKAAQ